MEFVLYFLYFRYRGDSFDENFRRYFAFFSHFMMYSAKGYQVIVIKSFREISFQRNDMMNRKIFIIQPFQSSRKTAVTSPAQVFIPPENIFSFAFPFVRPAEFVLFISPEIFRNFSAFKIFVVNFSAVGTGFFHIPEFVYNAKPPENSDGFSISEGANCLFA